MIDHQVFVFLEDLKKNNDREWFHAHKKTYDASRKNVEAFINKLIPSLRKFDETIDMITAKDCMFRIYRDIRFSPDKSPYKTNIGAYIARGGRKSQFAGYYVHVEPGSSFLAGGIYMPDSEVLKKIREEIYYNVDEFKAIINNTTFRKYFGEIHDENKLKNPPKGFDKEWPDIDLLKFKSYAVMHPVADEKLQSADSLSYAEETFKTLHAFNNFFNRILVH